MASDSQRVLLVEGNQKHMRSLVRTLKAIVGTLESREALGEVPADGDYALVAVSYDSLSDDDRAKLTSRFGGARTKTRLLLLSDGQHRDDFVQLFGEHSVTNMVARNNDEVDAEELIVTARKILDHDIFGIEKYFIWGVMPKTILVTSSTQKDAVVTAAADYARDLGVQDRFIAHFCTVADEFVTNAVYNAPVDGNGKRRFADKARTEEVGLAAHEAVEIKFCCDGRRLGISASDPFGTLTIETVLGYLAKCLRQGDDQIDAKQGGAGLGLYYIFDALSHFIINLAPGERTEMIGIIDMKGSYRDFAVRSKSFNIFYEGT
jgi:hypothetical protein